MDLIILLSLGVLFCLVGYSNIKGNITTIHWYNRIKVEKRNEKKYSKVMGLGTIIIGISIIITSLLSLIFNVEFISYITIIGLIIGIILMLYAQIKYNKGIF